MIRSSKLVKKSLVLQRDQSDCGVACLCSVIKYHGGDVSLEKLRKISGTSTDGTTLLGLLQASQQTGFEANGLQAESVNNLKEEITEPAILHVTTKTYLHHYLVYYPQINNDSLLILGDPAKGIVTMSSSELESIWISKALLKLTPTENFVKKNKSIKKKQKWIIELIKEDFPILFIALLIGVAMSFLGISSAIFSQKLVDDILPDGNSRKLLLGLVLVTLLLLVRATFSFLRGFFMIRQSADFNNRIIQKFYGSLLWLPKSFFDTRKIGELLARLNDTRRIQSALSLVLGNLIIDSLLALVSISFIFWYSIDIGLLMLICLPTYFLILIAYNKPINNIQREVMSGVASTESNFIDTMRGVTDIKLTNKQIFFERVNSVTYGNFQQKLLDLGKLNIRFGWLIETVGIFFTMSVFGLSSWLVLSKKLKLGEMVSLLSISASIMPSLNRLVVANIQIQEARVAFDRMFEFSSITPETESKILSVKLPENIRVIKAQQISFRFPGRRQILNEVTLYFSQGEIVSLLGENGGGKSTLLQLFQKFYTPESGKIEIDRINLNKVDLNDWRSRIASVSQELKIFNGNLLFNITLSDQLEEHQKAIDFCKQKGFDKYFQDLPQGYFTLLGEDGVNISGGQQQLIVLARALFRNPQILFLDEATSALDRNTENFVMDLLKKEKRNMAILLVTHRRKTAQLCDRTYYLDNGIISNIAIQQNL